MTATEASAASATALLDTLAETYPQLYLLAIIGSDAAPPPALVREVIAKGVKRHSSRVVAIANVLEGSGFRAAASRAVLIGLELIIRPPYAQKVFTRPSEAAAFLEKCNAEVSAKRIMSVVNQLRQRS